METNITCRQLGSLIFLLILSTAILYVPSVIYQVAKQHAWISPVVSFTFGFIIMQMIWRLHRWYPRQTLIQYAPQIAGVIPGKIIGVLYIWVYFHLTAIVTREFTEFTSSFVLNKTPMLVIAGFMIAVCAYAVSGGIECVGRIAIPIAAATLFVNILGFVLVLNYFDWHKLQPFWEEGQWLPILRGSFVPAGWFGEVIVLSSFLPHLTESKENNRTLVLFLTLTMIITVLDNLFAVSIFGGLNESLLFPVFYITRLISIADFLERVDPFFVIFWVSAIFVKITILYFALVQSIGEWLNLSNSRVTILPLGILLSLSSIFFFDNSSELNHFLFYSFVPYILFFEFFIPFILWIIAWWKQRKMSNKEG